MKIPGTVNVDVKPELISIYQFIMTMLLGAFSLIKTPDRFFSMIALALFITHLLDVSNSILVIGGIKPLEMDVLAIYVIVDIFTLIYLYHCFMDNHVDTILFKLMTIFLMIAYAVFTIQDALNWDLGLINKSFYLYIFYAFIDIGMLCIILWNEAKKDSFDFKIIYKKFKKKRN